MRIIAALVVVLLGIVASTPALAHGGGRYHHRSHTSFGVFVGPPLFWGYPYPYYYYPPAYYYPPVIPAPAAPTVYIERPDARPAPERAQDYWYYCPESQAYYPYVKQCAKGWQRLPPRPPGG